MADLASLAGGFVANTGETLLGFGVGTALAEALRPEATQLGQDAWALDPAKAVDPITAAAIVAEAVELLDWGRAEAAKSGIGSASFDAMLGEVLAGPGVGELLRMARRGTISVEDFAHGLRKAKLETRWDTALEELQAERLSPQELAVMVQRSVVPNDGLLPVTFDNAGSNVTPMPVAQIDTLTEAAAAGYDRERLAALARIVGLPPAPGELLQLVNRGAINEAAYRQGISEGNTRNEWADVLLTLKRRLLTPTQYAELRLRGWIDDAAMHAGAALSGMEPADEDLLFKVSGRPIPVHQVTTGLARGGSYNGSTADIPEAYIRSLEEGSQRPEWYSLSYANRYTYPSAFVIRLLATTGELDAAEVKQTLLDIGWSPDFAEKVTTAWTAGKTAKADPHIVKAEGQLWTAAHKSYVNGETDVTDATADLEALGVAVAAVPAVLALWDREREVVRRSLTPSQIKKAFKETKFTRDDAIARLERLGMNAADAATLLDE